MAKKILIDARMYGLEHSGIGRYLINLINELQKLDKKNNYTILLEKKYYKTLKLSKNFRKKLVNVKHYTLLEQKNLPKIIKQNNPDLVHFPHFNIPLFWKGKFVVTIHDLSMHRQGKEATTLSIPKYLLKKIPYRMVFKKAVKESEKILVPSKTVKKEIVDYYKVDEEKITVTYEGLDRNITDPKTSIGAQRTLEKFKLKPQQYFFYAGSVYPHKNIRRAVEAIALLNQQSGSKILFAIASSRSVFTNRLEKEVKKINAEKFVKFLGYVLDDELGILLNNAIAFVYPSLSEGFGLQGLESIASGTLVLASGIPVFREVYKDSVLYFNPFDFSSISKSMEEVIHFKPEERKEMINKGQQFIKRYSWSKMARQTFEVYKEAIQL